MVGIWHFSQMQLLAPSVLCMNTIYNTNFLEYVPKNLYNFWIIIQKFNIFAKKLDDNDSEET